VGRIRGVSVLLLAAALLAPRAGRAADAAPGMADAVSRGHALLRREAPAAGPMIAIIMDDLGEQRAAGLRALALPGPVALAFLPGGAHTATQAADAHERGKEVLLHLPLEPGDAHKRHPGAITQAIGRAGLAEAFGRALAAVPFARGVNNHQGSLLTQRAEPMEWLMAELSRRPGLYFVDSRTHTASIAYRVARARGVPAAERSVFLDAQRGADAVGRAFRSLLAKARRNGRALAIGHPYPETLALLEEELPRLAAHGVRLVPPSELIARPQRTLPVPRLRLSPSLTLAARTTRPAPPAAMSARAR
jgi:uncharacterized protein